MPGNIKIEVVIPISVPVMFSGDDEGLRAHCLEHKLADLVSAAMRDPHFQAHKDSYEFRARELANPNGVMGKPGTYILEFRYRGLRQRIKSCVTSVFSLFSAAERRGRERNREYGRQLLKKYRLVTETSPSMKAHQKNIGTRALARACRLDIMDHYSPKYDSEIVESRWDDSKSDSEVVESRWDDCAKDLQRMSGRYIILNENSPSLSLAKFSDSI